jgi:hypothetical protein
METAAQGAAAAMDAVAAATDLNIPTGGNVAIFADVEYNSNVTSSWIMGYADTLVSDGYRAGFYASEVSSTFPGAQGAFCSATSDANVSSAIVYASSPDADGVHSTGRTTEAASPAFAPNPTACSGGVTGAWQYGEPSTDGSSTPPAIHDGPNVDTDEIQPSFFSTALWTP